MGSKNIANVGELPGRLRIFVVMFFGLLLLGTVGYMLLLSVSAWDGFVLTIETLAFMAEHYDGPIRYLQLFLSLFGGFLVWWALWGFFDILFEENFYEYIYVSRMQARLRKMKDHYIIAGGGRVGDEIGHRFREKKSPYIIIEKSIERSKLLRSEGLNVLVGDVTEQATLVKANIRYAKAFIVAMPDTEKNLLITMLAKELRPDVTIYARADNPDFVDMLKKAGAKAVVVPEIAAADQLVAEIKEV